MLSQGIQAGVDGVLPSATPTDSTPWLMLACQRMSVPAGGRPGTRCACLHQLLVQAAWTVTAPSAAAQVYNPYLLINKKRYAGLLWTSPDKWDKMDAKVWRHMNPRS